MKSNLISSSFLLVGLCLFSSLVVITNATDLSSSPHSNSNKPIPHHRIRPISRSSSSPAQKFNDPIENSSSLICTFNIKDPTQYVIEAFGGHVSKPDFNSSSLAEISFIVFDQPITTTSTSTSSSSLVAPKGSNYRSVFSHMTDKSCTDKQSNCFRAISSSGIIPTSNSSSFSTAHDVLSDSDKYKLEIFDKIFHTVFYDSTIIMSSAKGTNYYNDIMVSLYNKRLDSMKYHSAMLIINCIDIENQNQIDLVSCSPSIDIVDLRIRIQSLQTSNQKVNQQNQLQEYVDVKCSNGFQLDEAIKWGNHPRTWQIPSFHFGSSK